MSDLDLDLSVKRGFDLRLDEQDGRVSAICHDSLAAVFVNV